MHITRRHARNIIALGAAFMIKWTRRATLLVVAAFVVAQSAIARAQTVAVNGPPGPVLETITPRFTIIARGFPVTARPLFFTLFISRNPTGEGAIEQTVTRTVLNDTIANLLVSRPLTSGATLYWKARVLLEDGITTYESPVSSARQVPEWVRLLKPGRLANEGLSTRQPLFQWQSPQIDPEFGFFSYDLQVVDDNTGATKISVSNIRDTLYVPTVPLEANTRYRAVLRAVVQPTGESVQAQNIGTFFIVDPSLPTSNLLYQNFPNPFPSPGAFSTCFWFDVKVGGAMISLDVLDLRGSVVKRIVPLSRFEAGPYGRGLEGTGSSCDGKYVWNGTGTDGRTVPGGVYLVRFTATGSPPQFKKIVFQGR